MKIYLVGMPGSGKTTLGKQVADELFMPFVDLDQQIENHEGKTIPEIFREKGEDHFRLVETQQLRNWAASKESFVMATGGGAPCFHSGMDVINQTGISIFLDVSLEQLVERLASKEDRPLLQQSNSDELMQKLTKLRSARVPVYEKAHVVLQNPTKTTLLNAIQLGSQR